MSLGSRSVVLEVSPTRRQLSVYRGETLVDARVDRLEPADARKTWLDTMSGLQERLARWVEQLNLQGARTTVIYTSPDSTAGVFSCPTAAGRVRATEAATLALGEATAFPLESNPYDVRCVAADKSGGGEDKPQQLHCLGAADSEICTQALTDCLKSAGLVPKAFIPIPAALLSAGLRLLAEEPKEPPAIGAVLWIGEHGSVLAAGNGERTAFLRHLQMGVESFVDALMRPQQNRPAGPGPDGPGPKPASGAIADRAAAREFLFTTGIPAPTAPGETPEPSARFLPLIQPVLQKFIVETKQSLRFGLSQQDRSSLTLRIAGPGAAIAGFADIIGRECGVDLATQPAPTTPADDKLRGDVSALMKAGAAPVSLLPREVQKSTMRRHLRTAMWVGVGLTIGSQAIDTASSWFVLHKERATLASLQQQASAPDASRLAYEKTRAARRGVAFASQKIERSLGTSPEWAATLAFLSEHTPSTIRLREIRADRIMPAQAAAPGQPGPAPMTTCKLSGFVCPDGPTTAATIIKNYIDTLDETPIFQFARLGMTHRDVRPNPAGGPGREVLTFEITLGLIELPHATATAPAASPGNGLASTADAPGPGKEVGP